MLDIARKRKYGTQAEWVEADARNVRLEQRFDLIVLTGHAFQVFLTSQDQLAVFKTIAAHLKPSGRFILDSRNPNFNASKSRENKTESHIFTHPEWGEVQMRNQLNYDKATRILTYQTGYDVLQTGQSFSQMAQILYTPKDELASMIAEAGLVVEEWLGDWDGNSFHQNAREIIPIGRLA
jgi:SAM-dependent methyltransferase